MGLFTAAGGVRGQGAGGTWSRGHQAARVGMCMVGTEGLVWLISGCTAGDQALTGQHPNSNTPTTQPQVDERSEERLGALLNLYGALHEHCAAQRQVFLTATEYARKVGGVGVSAACTCMGFDSGCILFVAC